MLRLGPTRAEVLDHLRTLDEPASVAAVSEAVGLHANTTRFHLDGLAAAGLVTREPESRERPGRPKYLYRALHPHPSSQYQDLAQAMVQHFASQVDDPSGRAEAAGQAWGDELRGVMQRTTPDQPPLERLVGAMTELGYQPKLVPEPARAPVVELTPCPYGQLASQDPHVVCQLHLGLARGLLGPDQPWEVVDLQPWVTATTCLLLLARDPAVPPARTEPAPGVADA